MKKRIIFIMGVSGSGKTTIGKRLANQLGLPFFDADDFHPVSNIEKMKAGQALNDEDRKPWLDALNRLAIQQLSITGAVITCSALKRKYRVQLTQGLLNHHVWIYLSGDFDLLYKRIKGREGHFMPPSLLKSQLETLEFPEGAFEISINQSPIDIVNAIKTHLSLKS